MEKKGISPVIATVLLIVVALALFVILFLWIRGFQKEAILKFNAPIENSCQNLNFQVRVSGSTVQVSNNGDVYIYKAKTIVYNADGKLDKSKDIEDIAQGESNSWDMGGLCTGQIKVIPILQGKTKSGATKEYVCENQAKTISC
ncbi:MAG: archaellin/type IV pilin N-terminal domain-containing protein [archaeon]